MSEKKEKQWLVQAEYITSGKRVKPVGLVWFDGRKQARDFAAKKNTTKRARRTGIVYRVYPMTRGPGA